MPVGLAYLLPEPLQSQVHALWRELDRAFGVRATAQSTPHPHITFHVAQTYDHDELHKDLTAWASSAESIPLQTWGAGVFGGDHPVIFIGVTQTTQLLSLHEAIYTIAQRHAIAALPIFAPSTWVAHITLAHFNVSAETIGPIMSWLTTQTLVWEFALDAVSLLQSSADEHNIDFTVTW